MNCKGDIFVISAPSGAGKSTFIKRLFEDLCQLSFSVSYTTRSPRDGEIYGRDYFFIDDATFDKMIAEHGFIEWVQVYAHRYGTGKAWIQEQIDKGQDVLLDLETIGAGRVKEIFPEATLIFLMPPSAQALEDRLRGRDKDTEAQIAIRMAQAKHEMEHCENYSYLILNDNLEAAYQTFKAIFVSARAAKKRMRGVAMKALATFEGNI